MRGTEGFVREGEGLGRGSELMGWGWARGKLHKSGWGRDIGSRARANGPGCGFGRGRGNVLARLVPILVSPASWHTASKMHVIGTSVCRFARANSMKIPPRNARLLRFGAALWLTALHLAANADAQPVGGWELLPIGQVAPKSAAGDPVVIALDGRNTAGRWLRTSATVQGQADLLPLIHGYKSGALISRATPRHCVNEQEQAVRICSALGWIPNDADEVRIRWWNRAGHATNLRDVKVEVWSGTTQEEAVRQLRGLMERVHEKYAWRSEVDWIKLERELTPMLAAPLDDEESPLPQIGAELIQKLPRHEHMAVAVSPIERPGEDIGDWSLPSCSIKQRTLTVRLPATPPSARGAQAYLVKAHACFNRRASFVTLDLRESLGGDAQLMIAAAAPVLPRGLQLSYVNNTNEAFDVILGSSQVRLGKEVQYQFAPVRRSYTASQVTAILGPRCASACEALAIALRGNAKLVGEPTAGYTTANEEVRLDADRVLIVTSGWMRDRSGRITNGPVRPDQVLPAAPKP